MTGPVAGGLRDQIAPRGFRQKDVNGKKGREGSGSEVTGVKLQECWVSRDAVVDAGFGSRG